MLVIAIESKTIRSDIHDWVVGIWTEATKRIGDARRIVSRAPVSGTMAPTKTSHRCWKAFSLTEMNNHLGAICINSMNEGHA